MKRTTQKLPPIVCPCTKGVVHVPIILVGAKAAKNVFLVLYRQKWIANAREGAYYAADGKKNDEQNVSCI